MIENLEPMLFAGSSHPELADEIVGYLNIPLGQCLIRQFADNETFVEIQEPVRGRDVFVVQSIAGRPNDYLFELLIMIDALKRSSARTIVAVLPYFGYARQDRKDRDRVPISARLIANLLERAGVSSVVTMDLHALQIQGFFDVPLDHLEALPNLIEAVEGWGVDVVVCPDVGSIKLARRLADQLGIDFGVVAKRRISEQSVESLHVMGDFEGKRVLLVDDMCTTGGTLIEGAKACLEQGALSVDASVTHGLFVGKAVEKLEQSAIRRILITNTIPGSAKLARENKKIEEVSVANLFGEAIRQIFGSKAIASLFR